MVKKQVKPLSSTQLAFRNAYQGYLSRNTLNLYLRYLGDLENHTVVAKSRAVLGHIFSICNKCKNIGIEIPVPPDIQSKWDSFYSLDFKAASPAAIKAFLKKIPNTEKGNELKLALNIAWRAGLRRSEILRLTPKDVIIRNDGVFLHVDGGKHQQSRNVGVNGVNLKPFLMDFKGFSITTSYCNSAILKANFNSEVPINFMVLKFTFIKESIERGMRIEDLKHQIGAHSLAGALQYIQKINNKRG